MGHSSYVTRAFLHALYFALHTTPQGARARVERFYIAQNTEVTTLAWELILCFSGGLWDIQANSCLFLHVRYDALYKAPQGARARVERPILPSIEKSQCWPGN